MKSQGVNAAFREAVTASTFSLTLGRGMIRTLYEISLGRRSDFRPILYPQWSATVQALHRRGLIEARDLLGRTYDSPYAENFRLTEAGKLVLRLCQIAGLVPETQPRREPEVQSRD